MMFFCRDLSEFFWKIELEKDKDIELEQKSMSSSLER